MRSIKTKKEIAQRYDFRGSDASIELEEKCIKLAAEDEYKLNAIIDMLRARMAKRDITLRCLELGKVEPASKRHSSPDTYYPAGYTEGKKPKAIVAAIKATKLKVKCSDAGRSGTRQAELKKDDLQAVIQNAESRRLQA